MIWYKEQIDDDIVVSTRIRLARNISGLPFPRVMNAEQKQKAVSTVRDAVIGGNSTLASMFDFTDINALSDMHKQSLIEEHIISPELAEKEGGALLRSNDGTMSIMLMEEDCIRLQIIRGGLCLDEAWETADKVDDVIEESVEYAFDSEFGYLTSCPTNTGTGLRASVMMHLPALVMAGGNFKNIFFPRGHGVEGGGVVGGGGEKKRKFFLFFK